MELTIQHKYLLGLGNWLQTLSLFGPESRERTKFVELLRDEINEMEITRLEIVKKYAKLGEDGEPVLVDGENGQKHYEIADDKMKDFTGEYSKYLESDFTCGGSGLKTRLQTVKNIVLNPSVKIEPNFADDYDKWCSAFEAIKAE